MAAAAADTAAAAAAAADTAAAAAAAAAEPAAAAAVAAAQRAPAAATTADVAASASSTASRPPGDVREGAAALATDAAATDAAALSTSSHVPTEDAARHHDGSAQGTPVLLERGEAGASSSLFQGRYRPPTFAAPFAASAAVASAVKGASGRSRLHSQLRSRAKAAAALVHGVTDARVALKREPTPPEPPPTRQPPPTAKGSAQGSAHGSAPAHEAAAAATHQGITEPQGWQAYAAAAAGDPPPPQGCTPTAASHVDDSASSVAGESARPIKPQLTVIVDGGFGAPSPWPSPASALTTAPPPPAAADTWTGGDPWMREVLRNAHEHHALLQKELQRGSDAVARAAVPRTLRNPVPPATKRPKVHQLPMRVQERGKYAMSLHKKRYEDARMEKEVARARMEERMNARPRSARPTQYVAASSGEDAPAGAPAPQASLQARSGNVLAAPGGDPWAQMRATLWSRLTQPQFYDDASRARPDVA